MIKRIVLPVLLSVLFCLPAFAAAARFIPGTATELPQLVTSEGKTYKLGKKPYPAGTREKWIAEGRVLAKAPEGYLPQGKLLKGAADNRSYLPPIGDQSSEGSCVHWAGSYNTKTANMKWKDPSINVNAASNQCSPRFTYNLSNAGADNGGYGHEPFEIFMRYGGASLAQKPYVAGQYTTLPVAADFIEGLHRRTTNYVWLWDFSPDAAQITELKAWLDAGHVAACGVYAEETFDAWGAGDAPWVGTTCTIDDINHMVTVCGYGTGFYLVANQWGTSFGSNGYIVVDSDYFENYFSDVMYPLEGSYAPATDYAKLTIKHTVRSDVRELLLTANGVNVWSNSPLPLNMPPGGGGTFDTDSRDNLELAIDLSNVAWDPTANVVTARVKDAVSANVGTVTVFSVMYDGTEYASTVVPVTVPYNSYTSAWVRLYQSTDTNVSFTASGASVGEGSGSYVVTVYKTQASGDVSGQVVVSGTATEGAGADYTISGTNFTLNAATTSATFTVTLNDDADEELAETVVLTLANVSGGIVQDPSVFTLTINPSDLTGGSVLISQYTETDSGTTPKGIEIWNASAADLTFDSGANLLDVKVGMNAGTPASVLTVSSGTLAAGDVWVIGTSDMTPDIEEPFSFNGDDSIVLELGGVVQDVIGTPGVDPGSEWASNGVSTANQNIQLKLGTTFGDPDGWTDPSERFETVGAGSVLTGFGEPPGGWSDVPPVLASIGNKSAIWSNDLSFSVSATDAVDGDSIVLSASNLPAGAVFATVTNAGTVTNTFVWNDVGPLGVYTSTFYAVDKDGTDSETITITVGDGSGPSEIVFQGFEGTASDTWGITAANNVQNLPGAADTPANQRIRTGSYSWQPGDSEEVTEVLELAEVDVSTYSDVVMTLHLSATSTDTNHYGMFPTDTMSFYLGLNGGAYPSAADLTVTGNELVGGSITGALWSYTASGVAATTAGVSRSVAPASGGVTADGLATVQIALPPGTTAVKLKASVYQEYAGYYWNIDDVTLAGIADGGAQDFAPFIAVSPDGTEKSIAISNNLSFAITGREVPNDAADEIRIWATGLPAGATFPEASGVSILTNVFSWTPETTGTTVVSFFAGDKDGTNQVDVTIEVFEQLPAGTYRAVICGISDYEGTANDLNYCDDDAQELYDRLLSGSNWSADNVQLLLDSQATEPNIQAAIAAMGAASVPGDVNLFFFSGHGGGDMPDADGDEGGDGYDEYMCPYNLTTDEITDDELSDWLDALPTDNIIVLLDTCFSGGHLKAANGLTYKGYSRTGKMVAMANGFADDLRKKTKKDSDELVSPYIATACDETELSAEDPVLENGVFAYYLLEALTNSDVNVDGWAAGEETFDYLYPLTVASNPEQHPQEYDGWPGLANILTWAPLADQPPTIALDPAGTNKTAIIDTAMSFTVTATDSDGLAVSLAVSGLPSGATAPDTNGTGAVSTTFNWTPTAAQTGVYHVAFSATDDDGTTVRGVQITVRDGSVATDLFISEYVEGSSNNKAVEIFNGTGASVDLGAGGYVLRIYANGSSSPSSITLAGTVADGDVFVVAKNDANAAILALADQTSASLTHNGNDVVALAKNDANLDVVGTIGSSADFALNVTKVRKSTVLEGTTTYDPLEWDDYPVDTLSYLGSHEFGAGDPTPPVLNAIGNQSVTEGQDLQFQVTATPTDSDTVTLTASNLPGVATFNATNQNGTFQWLAASPTGVYSVTFYATDKDGSDSETISITVGEAGSELLAPVIQAASLVQAQQFTANWLASSGATGYWLDVDTNGTFTAGGGGRGATHVSENIQSWTAHAGYGAWTQAISAGAVTMTQCIVAPAAAASGVGTVGRVQLQASTGILELPALNTVGTVTMNIAAGGASRTAKLQKYNGSTWDDLTTWSGIGTNGAAFTYDVNDSGSSVRLRIASPSSAIYVHDIAAVSYGGGGGGSSYVPGYENRDVGAATACVVTGLTEGVTYYYRAKAYNLASNSPYSAVTSVVTTASAGTPPTLNPIGGQEVFLGYDLQFQVSATPTEADAVTLTASNLPAGATFNATNENGTFQWLSATPTGEYSVVFYAADNDGSDGEAVGIYVYPLPQVGGFVASNGASASATFRSVNGQTYRMEFSLDLMANPVVWSEADSDVGDGNDLTLSDTNNVDLKRFYRIVAP